MKKFSDLSREVDEDLERKIQELYDTYGEIDEALIKKLNSVKGLTDTFIRTDNGYKVTNPEGYVAIDRVGGKAVKLVDRMEFSFNNFTAIKAWDK